MHDAVAAAPRLPGWEPRQAWGAVVLDSDMRAANAVLEQMSPSNAMRRAVGQVAGVPASQIAQTLHSPGSGAARQQAMDVYLAGLGTLPLPRLTSEYGVRGASLTLRALFDQVGWETDHFLQL